MMPPKAASGSHAKARPKASVMVSPTAAPQGLLCFTMTAAGPSKSRARVTAESRSRRLLNESSLPWSIWKRTRASAGAEGKA